MQVRDQDPYVYIVVNDDLPPFYLEGQFNFLNVSFIGFYRGRPKRLAGGELSGCSSLHVEQGGEEDKVCMNLFCWLLFSGFSVFTFLTVIVVCLFHGSSLLQGTHTLSAHHRQSARSHTGEFNLVVGNVCYQKYWTFCPLMLSFTFCSFKENVYRVLINIVQLAFSPKWLSTGEMLKTCIFFCIWPTFTHYMQLTPEWQDTELQPCWCPGSFHQRLCWRHRTMESGKKTLIPSHWVIMYFKSTRLMMLSVTNSMFHPPGAVHQPARGAALLLRSQATPSPCSRRSQVASIQVKLAFCLLKMLTLLIHHSSRPGLKLDERSAALIQMKCLPLASAIQTLYPDMYR